MYTLLKLFQPFLLLLFIPGILYHLIMGFVLFVFARAKSIPFAWLAWLPVGQQYVTGSLADDIGGNDRFFGYGKSYYRHILACCQIVSLFIVFLPFIITAAGGDSLVLSNMMGDGMILGTVLDIVFFAIMVMNVYVIYKIFSYYTPHRAVLFSVLSVAVGPLKPVFLFIAYRTLRGQKNSFWKQSR